MGQVPEDDEEVYRRPGLPQDQVWQPLLGQQLHHQPQQQQQHQPRSRTHSRKKKKSILLQQLKKECKASLPTIEKSQRNLSFWEKRRHFVDDVERPLVGISFKVCEIHKTRGYYLRYKKERRRHRNFFFGSKYYKFTTEKCTKILT